ALLFAPPWVHATAADPAVPEVVSAYSTGQCRRRHLADSTAPPSIMQECVASRPFGRIRHLHLGEKTMREQPQTRRPGLDNRRLGSLMAALSLQALTFIPPAKIAETVRHWLGQGTGPRDDREEAKRLLDAVGLASDLALFAPSASGTT